MDTKTVNLRDIPEELVRRAKACAALHGMSLKDFVIQAVRDATEADIPAIGLPMAAHVSLKPKTKRKAKGE